MPIFSKTKMEKYDFPEELLLHLILPGEEAVIEAIGKEEE